MTLSIRKLIALSIISSACGAAFLPAQKSARLSSVELNFKFLKDMGLEKPSWLPDFGGKKEESDAKPVEDEAKSEDESKTEAAAMEE